jgi:EAL domain-containing protein (putative c-di-GMP-specific phosphodiesterase class I)
MQADFVSVVADVLKETGLDPKWLQLEITESVVLKDIKSVVQRLTHLRKLGVTIAVDDFGTGYSSMAYIQQLPIDCLKMDRSFVQDIEACSEKSQRSRALIEAFVNLAQRLGIQAVAEGVENADQYEYLREIGCRCGQGFLLNVPMSAEEIEFLCKEGVPIEQSTSKTALSIENINVGV